MYIDRSTARIILAEQSKQVRSKLRMVESWDQRPKSDFTETQMRTLNNLREDLIQLLKSYDQVIEAFK